MHDDLPAHDEWNGQATECRVLSQALLGYSARRGRWETFTKREYQKRHANLADCTRVSDPPTSSRKKCIGHGSYDIKKIVDSLAKQRRLRMKSPSAAIPSDERMIWPRWRAGIFITST